MEGRKRIGIVLGWLFLLVPAQASGWMIIKIQTPAERWDLRTLPLAPAPFENPGKPLWLKENAPFWTYPTVAEFVAYPVPPQSDLWVAQALEKYRIRMMSPFDLPYTTLAKAPLFSR